MGYDGWDLGLRVWLWDKWPLANRTSAARKICLHVAAHHSHNMWGIFIVRGWGVSVLGGGAIEGLGTWCMVLGAVLSGNGVLELWATGMRLYSPNL